MKKILIIFASILFLNTSFLFGQNYTSITSGDWNNPTTWSPSGIPGVGDDVVIGNHSVTITADANCNSLTTNPGSDIGTSTITVNETAKLTVAEYIYVESTNSNNNTTYLNGLGSLETNFLYIGDELLTATSIKTTTLFVEDLQLLTINDDINIYSRVNTTNATNNLSRLRHKSGVIELGGQLNSFVQSSTQGITNLGYVTNNTSQGDSKIVFKNATPAIPSSGLEAPNFTGGSVEFRSTATTLYDLPFLTYKSLILNSPRTFRSTNNTTTIGQNGSIYLLNGIVTGQTSGPTVRYITYENNATIFIANGTFQNVNGSRPRLLSTTSTYNVVYLQTNSIKQSGRELTPVSAGPNPFGTITVNNTNGVSINTDVNTKNLVIETSCALTGSGKIVVAELFNVPNSSSVNLQDGMVRLLSIATNTARVPSLLNNPTITGKVVVERYLQNTSRHWRLLTAPVKGSTDNSVYYNWQNNGLYGGLLATGIDFWGPDGTLSFDDNGFTIPGNGLINITNSSYNLRKYNNTAGSWANVTNTLAEPLFNSSINSGFLIFAPHSFLNASDYAGGFIPNQSALTVSATGELLTGNITYSNIFNNKYYLIGNPYASPINFQSILSDPSNQGVKKIWVIDPNVGAFGGYVTWDAIAGYSNIASGFSTNTIFQSGQAFFVLAHGSDSLIETTLTIKESHKSDVITNDTLSRTTANQTASGTDLFRILLEKEVQGIYSNMDGCVAAFYQGGNNDVDSNDGYKLSNPGENLALLNGTTSLSIEHRNTILDNDYLTLRLTQAVVGSNYKLKLYTENFSYSGNAYLQDLFVGSTTQLPTDGSIFEYPFQVTSNAQSIGNRFKIVFQATVLNNVNLASNFFSIYPNPATNDENISIMFNSSNDSTEYTYKIYNNLGQLLQSDVLSRQEKIGYIPLSKTLTTGLYFIELLDKTTNQKYSQSLLIK